MNVKALRKCLAHSKPDLSDLVKVITRETKKLA